MAEREGFEPSVQCYLYTHLAGEPLQPLGHLSKNAPGAIRTPDLLVRSQLLYPTELQVHAAKRPF